MKPFNDPMREAAEKSLQALQNELEGPAELKNVWQRLDDLQRDSAKLKQQLETSRSRQNRSRSDAGVDGIVRSNPRLSSCLPWISK